MAATLAGSLSGRRCRLSLSPNWWRHQYRLLHLIAIEFRRRTDPTDLWRRCYNDKGNQTFILSNTFRNTRWLQYGSNLAITLFHVVFRRSFGPLWASNVWLYYRIYGKIYCPDRKTWKYVSAKCF
jgi:hypothetical protein